MPVETAYKLHYASAMPCQAALLLHYAGTVPTVESAFPPPLPDNLRELTWCFFGQKRPFKRRKWVSPGVDMGGQKSVANSVFIVQLNSRRKGKEKPRKPKPTGLARLMGF